MVVTPEVVALRGEWFTCLVPPTPAFLGHACARGRGARGFVCNRDHSHRLPPACEKKPVWGVTVSRQHAETFEHRVGRVTAAIAAGVSVGDAGREVGVSRRTVQRWIARGRDEAAHPALRRLALRVDAARRRQQIGTGVISSLPEIYRVIDRAARAGSVEAMRLVYRRLLQKRAA